MSMSATSQQYSSQSMSRGQYARIGAITVATAIVANVIFYYLAQVFVEYHPDFVILETPFPTILFTLVPAAIAVILYGLLRRHSSNPERTFTIIAAVVLVLSVIPDFAMIPGEDGASNGQIAVLATMHVIAAAVIVGMLTRLAPGRSG